jgi:hypothetical protein
VAEQSGGPDPYADAYRAYVQAVKDHWANVDVDAVVAQAGAQAIPRVAPPGMGMASAGCSVASSGMGMASAACSMASIGIGMASAGTRQGPAMRAAIACGGHRVPEIENCTGTIGTWGSAGTVGGCVFSVACIGTFGCLLC